MPKRVSGWWFTAILLACLCLGMFFLWAVFETGHSIGRSKGEQGVFADALERQAEQDVAQRCVGLDPEAIASCIETELEASRGYQLAERDLVAQIEAAEWAQWSAVIAGLMAAITVVGVVYIHQTLIATREMSADTRRIGEAQVRAYVAITKASVKLSPPDPGMTGVNMKTSVTISVKNFGNSPARWFQWGAQTRFSPPQANRFTGPTIRNFSPSSWGKDIGPGETLTLTLGLGSATVPDEVLNVLESREIYIDIAIGYGFQDVFGEWIEDERVFATSLMSSQIATDVVLHQHPFTREVIDKIAKTYSPENFEKLSSAVEV